VLRHELAVHEALDRIQRRAQADHWPAHSRVLVTLRDVRALRSRLEALARGRLGELSHVSGAPSLVEDLTRLEELLFQSIPLELAAGEVRLLEGDTADVSFVLRVYVLIIGALVLGPISRPFGEDLVPFAVLVLLVANVFHGVLRSGKYRLTSERLVWKPHTGEPVQLPLRSIPEGGIQPTLFGVRVVGERKLFIQDVKQGHLLAVLLELRRQAPLLGSARAERLSDVLCCEATLRNGAVRRSGYAVVRPGYVAFLPKDQGTQVLWAITGTKPPLHVRAGELPHLIEQLQYLPSEAAFDACVERAVAAAGGVRWSAWDVRYKADAPEWKELRFEAPEPGLGSLSGKVGWSQRADAERLLAHWPKR
jgi:hypothetical protein